MTLVTFLNFFACKILFRKLLKLNGTPEALPTAWGFKLRIAESMFSFFELYLLNSKSYKVTLCLTAKHALLPKMFEKDNKKVSSGSSRKLVLKSNGSTFRTNLNILMEKLNSTGSSFIRCIKPNQEMKSGCPNSKKGFS